VVDDRRFTMAIISQHYSWATIEVVLSSILVMIRNRMLEQRFKKMIFSDSHEFCCLESIGKERRSAFTGVAEAVEELQAWRILKVQEVHVQSQILIGVRHVFGFRDRSDIPCPTVECFSDIPETTRNFLDSLFSIGDVVDDDNAKA
jgi:hypothetical protein